MTRMWRGSMEGSAVIKRSSASWAASTCRRSPWQASTSRFSWLRCSVKGGSMPGKPSPRARPSSRSALSCCSSPASAGQGGAGRCCRSNCSCRSAASSSNCQWKSRWVRPRLASSGCPCCNSRRSSLSSESPSLESLGGTDPHGSRQGLSWYSTTGALELLARWASSFHSSGGRLDKPKTCSGSCGPLLWRDCSRALRSRSAGWGMPLGSRRCANSRSRAGCHCQ